MDRQFLARIDQFLEAVESLDQTRPQGFGYTDWENLPYLGLRIPIHFQGEEVGHLEYVDAGLWIYVPYDPCSCNSPSTEE